MEYVDYSDIIYNIGSNLNEYDASAWNSFREMASSEITSQFIFGSGSRPDETLLGYSMGYIEKSNNIVRGVNTGSKFTYYTEKGPKKNIKDKPVLPDPLNGSIRKSDFKPKITETTYSKKGGVGISGEYNDRNRFNNNNNNFSGSADNQKYDIVKNTDNYTLLSKTKEWFEKGRFATLISRFHTDDDQMKVENLRQSVSVQTPSQFGLSHGNNLLKVKGEGENAQVNRTTINGYTDPYCRVWTWHKQYASFVKDTIRPFNDTSINNLMSENLGYSNRLKKYGVMYDNDEDGFNGLVNITPSMKKNSTKYSDPGNVSVEHCMFSIENLAWKGTYSNWDDGTDPYGLSREQKGPLGGRIMWFPPYDLKFSEDTTANWQSNDFIGRGEPIYTYANTTRGGSLSFKLLIDHPAILDYWERRMTETGTPEKSGVDNVDSKEQELLRFFAGCSILKPGEEIKEEETEIDQTENENQEDGVDGNVMQFFVFFPNNYSGVDDLKSQNSVVDPIAYLMNGVGAQKYTDKANGCDIYAKDIKDLPTDVNTTYKYHNDRVGGYEMTENGRGVSIITNETTVTNVICEIDIDNSTKKINLAKMFSEEYAVKDPCGEEQEPESKMYEWNLYRYYYRCDKDGLGDRFISKDEFNTDSYIDKRSYALNLKRSDKYGKFLENVIGKGETYTMAEVFVAVVGKDNAKAFSDEISQENITKIQKVLSKENIKKIKKIEIIGRASSQGNNDSQEINNSKNFRLAENRAKTIKNWLKEKLGLDDSLFEIKFSIDNNKNYAKKESSNINAKLNRFAAVRIMYDESAVSDSSETDYQNGENDVIIDEEPSNDVEPNEDVPTENYSNDTSNLRNERYDGEARFFTKLEKNDPFMAKLISERINNFHPVFHSMSPEGFNARLTFLNQCMRQGPTISSFDTNDYNANNLSFGRPPVCVLRVGDFYNTKIIINSLNITYDPLVWDLNDEGIGVMPMIANITLSFKFIGGSDLAGPIQRLQNATSFNYYANASVYDNRAEMIEYNDGKYIRFDTNPMQK